MAVRAATSAATDEGEGGAVQRGAMHGVDDVALANAFWRETAIKSAGGCNADEEAGNTEGGTLAGGNAARCPCSFHGRVVQVLQRM